MAKLGCPKNPGHDIMLVEYAWNDPDHYDGVSEIDCRDCGKRYGRWSGKELAEGEKEPRFGIEGYTKRTVVLGAGGTE